ncbi:MAG: D-sedoheptulose-7-phosphate isomerase [Acutalibacteraceae bacterium]
MQQKTNEILEDLTVRLPKLNLCRESIAQAFELLCSCFALGGKLMVCGNGGSGADAQHIVGELMKEFARKREIQGDVPAKLRQLFPEDQLETRLQAALPAVALGVNQAFSSAYANDADPEMVFAQELYGFGKEHDILLALSTSGNSSNVLNAVKVAKAMGVQSIGICGGTGGRLKKLCDTCILLPETETYLVQELTLPVYHALCRMVETYFWGI